MIESYVTAPLAVRGCSAPRRLARALAGPVLLVLAGATTGATQSPPATSPPATASPTASPAATSPPAPAGQTLPAVDPSGDPILLQLRLYDGTSEVTSGARLQLYPRGQRSAPVPLAVGADRAHEARVAPGFYDVQAVREADGQIAGIRWVEQLLVQRYPDEYGRHLQVVNFRPEFGALQVRPAPEAAAAARGWTAALFKAGDETREVARARPVGSDLLFVVPAGRYDVRVTAADKAVAWIRDVEIPPDGTRLKTWSAPAP